MTFRIFSYISPRALGDVVLFAWFSSSLADMFDDCELTVYFRNDRPYKSHIVSCIRNASRVLKQRGATRFLPIELFDMAGWRHEFPDEINSPDVRDPDLILSQPLFKEAMLNSIPLNTMAPPPHLIEPSNTALMKLGLDPEKWIATFYWKEANYGFRPREVWREIADPAPYIAAIRHVVENLGGQVVRLGHPTPTKLPKMKGVIDLAQVPNSEWEQLYAVWVSRFLMSSLSGPLSYGPAFNVPTVVTDQRTALGVYRDQDYIVTQAVIDNGKVFEGRAAFDAGLLKTWGKDPRKFVNNTAKDLMRAVDEMYKSTANCPGWRAHPEPQKPAQRPNFVRWPVPVADRPQLLIPPSQRAKTLRRG